MAKNLEFYSDKTLLNWKKKELIAYIRQLEHSVENLDERLDVQARNMSKYEPVIHAHWKPSKEPKHEKEFSRFFVCTNCSHDIQLRHAGIVEDIGFEYCPHCGAKMDEVNE